MILIVGKLSLRRGCLKEKGEQKILKNTNWSPQKPNLRSFELSQNEFDRQVRKRKNFYNIAWKFK